MIVKDLPVLPGGFFDSRLLRERVKGTLVDITTKADWQ
jgi:hypothetical protein